VLRLGLVAEGISEQIRQAGGLLLSGGRLDCAHLAGDPGGAVLGHLLSECSESRSFGGISHHFLLVNASVNSWPVFILFRLG
jgi:hypothetical protein